MNLAKKTTMASQRSQVALKNQISPGSQTVSPKEKKTRQPGAFFDFIITLSIALVFFSAPLFFTNLTAQGLGFDKAMLFYFFVLTGLVAWVTKGVALGELKIKRTPLDIPIMFFLLIFIVSSFLSVNPKDSLIGSYGDSIKGLVGVVAFILFYYLLVNNLNLKKIKIVFWTLISSTVMVLVYSFLQLKGVFILPFVGTKTASFNPIGTSGGLTTFIFLILPLLAVGFSQVREIFPKLPKIGSVIIKFVLFLALAAALAILVMLSSYLDWPAKPAVGLVGMVILLMFFMSKIIAIANKNLIIPVALFLLMIAILVMGNNNYFSLSLPAEINLSRTASWDIAKSSLKENPFFGSGPSTFYYNFSKHKDLSFNNTEFWNARFDRASGSMFELLSTIGILGSLSLVIIVLIALPLSFLTLIKSRDNASGSVVLGLFSVFMISILSLLMFPMGNSLLLIIMLLALLAVSSSFVLYPEKFKEFNFSFRAAPKYALALSAIFLTVSAGVVIIATIGIKMYMADALAKKALAAEEIGKKAEHINEAIKLAPFQDYYYVLAANIYLNLANQEANAGQNQALIAEYLGQAINLARKSVDLADKKAQNNESLAFIYESSSFFVSGSLEFALKYYEKLAELEPINPTPDMRIALINTAIANMTEDEEIKKSYYQEAVKYYGQAIAKKPDLAAAYYSRGVIYEAMENLDQAIEEVKQASLYSGGQPDYLFELGRMFFNRGMAKVRLDQTDDRKIPEPIFDPETRDGGEEDSPGFDLPSMGEEIISVRPSTQMAEVADRNEDIDAAEQIFLNIMRQIPNHANALFSLLVLYERIGEDDNARIAYAKLMEILPEDENKEALKEQFGRFE